MAAEMWRIKSKARPDALAEMPAGPQAFPERAAHKVQNAANRQPVVAFGVTSGTV
jgi:hypothetical protein